MSQNKIKNFSMSYNLLAKSISNGNRNREGNLEIAQVYFWKFLNCQSKKRVISKILKIYTKNCSNQTCDYCLITPNQQTLYIETNIFSQRAITNQRVAITK